MHSEFKVTFRVLSKVHFRQDVYCFEDLEVKNPMLQTVCKSKLKRESYVHLKQTSQRGRLSSKLTT